jgi:hypothetical protein
LISAASASPWSSSSLRTCSTGSRCARTLVTSSRLLRGSGRGRVWRLRVRWGRAAGAGRAPRRPLCYLPRLEAELAAAPTAAAFLQGAAGAADHINPHRCSQSRTRAPPHPRDPSRCGRSTARL